jgi:radical SAM superfamily enzyme YgiQ (UPF0313 family)
MRVLLLYPQTPETFWSFKHVLRFVSKRASLPPLGLLTLAGLLPKEWEIKLVDLNVEPLSDQDLRWAEYVMISAMIVQKDGVRRLVQRCQQCNKTVIAGGPLFFTEHAAFPEIQHFVLGEAENVMPQLVADMLKGTLQPTYSSPERPDVTESPIPRWDLLQLRQYVTMAVQFSRGCPFDCEFCDIPVLSGRVPRTKRPSQLVAELEQLRLHGWRDMVFVVDDNFIGNKKQTKALLREIIDWRTRTKAGMGFLTEASANLADDPEMCELMVRAGFKKVFIGIETPSAQSLEECRKLQNCQRNLVDTIQILQRAGLEVMGGFIIGFDHDEKDIFKRQFEFIQRSGVVTAMVGLLNALPDTRLYRRLRKEGRLDADTTGNNTEAKMNFRPKLDREFLTNGYRDLMKRLYEPRHYYQRIRTFLASQKPAGPRLHLSRADLEAFVKSLWLLGVWHRGRFAYWWFMAGALLRRPRQFPKAMELAIIGHHFRRVAREL